MKADRNHTDKVLMVIADSLIKMAKRELIGNPTKSLLKTGEVATCLGVSISRVRKLHKSGLLKRVAGHKSWLFNTSDVMELKAG